MSTRSFVAFRDGESTTGIYVHFDGYPEGRLPVLQHIYHHTFFRDLGQLRTTLLKYSAGWSMLDPDDAYAAEYAAGRDADRFTHIPGVGVAYTEDFDMTATGDEVFREDYAYVFDMADASLKVYDGDRLIMDMAEAAWAPIGPDAFGRDLLPIVAADPVGEVCLTGVEAVYTEGHINRLIPALSPHLIDDGQLAIRDGGDLFDFFHAAVETGLLPGQTWFITDGDGEGSDGGWIRLPIDLAGVDVQAMFIEAADFANGQYTDYVSPGLRREVRDLLEFMQQRIAVAMRSLAAWRAPKPRPSYADACRQAATDQGLDPITAALTAAGIAHDVDQTGGFCMVVHVPTPHGFHIGITASEERDVDRSRHWLMLRRSDTDYDDEGEIIGFAVPTPAVIALLAGYLSAPGGPSVSDAVSRAVNTSVDWLKDVLDVDEGPVDDLLNLVVNAAVHAAEHPEDGTLEDAIRANYDEGDGCTECDDPDDCDDPEHDGIVDEVLGWLEALR